jgi:hypothetical protein
MSVYSLPSQQFRPDTGSLDASCSIGLRVVPGPAPGAGGGGPIVRCSHRHGGSPPSPPPRHPHTNPTDSPNRLGTGRQLCVG